MNHFFLIEEICLKICAFIFDLRYNDGQMRNLKSLKNIEFFIQKILKLFYILFNLNLIEYKIEL
jgi:hypothetical protein